MSEPSDHTSPDVPNAPSPQSSAAAESTRGEDRRARTDRRREPSSDERRGRRPPARGKELLQQIVGYAFGILALVCVILFAVAHTRPIFAGRQTIGQQLLRQARQQAATTGDTTGPGQPGDTLSRNAKFEADRRAFAEDLLRHGHIDSARADSVAYYAVREAYQRDIPPALIFGVMLTENSVFKSQAQSNVGAVGLMQVYPKVWLKSLKSKFGVDLASDSTNLKYGTFILSQYLRPKKTQNAQASDISRGLLHYNGCVKGTNTPHCTTYPNKVVAYVEKEAQSLCGGRSFYDCVTRPFVNGLFGRDPTEQTASR